MHPQHACSSALRLRCGVGLPVCSQFAAASARSECRLPASRRRRLRQRCLDRDAGVEHRLCRGSLREVLLNPRRGIVRCAASAKDDAMCMPQHRNLGSPPAAAHFLTSARQSASRHVLDSRGFKADPGHSAQRAAEAYAVRRTSSRSPSLVVLTLHVFAGLESSHARCNALRSLPG